MFASCALTLRPSTLRVPEGVLMLSKASALTCSQSLWVESCHFLSLLSVLHHESLFWQTSTGGIIPTICGLNTGQHSKFENLNKLRWCILGQKITCSQSHFPQRIWLNYFSQYFPQILLILTLTKVVLDLCRQAFSVTTYDHAMTLLTPNFCWQYSTLLFRENCTQ